MSKGNLVWVGLLLAVMGVTAGASSLFLLGRTSTTTASLASSSSASVVSSSTASTNFSALPECGYPSYLSVAAKLEATPQFLSAEGNISDWVMIYAGNESGSYGNATTTIYYREVAFAFYSFFNKTEYEETARTCGFSTCSIKYVLEASVPITIDGNYNFSKASAFSERYYSNGTICTNTT